MLSFPREIGLKRQLCSSETQYTSYVADLGPRTACYTSLYHYEDLLPNQRRVDYNTAVMDRAWWDCDAGPRSNIDAVKDDVFTLISRLDGDIRVVATGRGFHVHQMFDSPVQGFEAERNLGEYSRHMAKGLDTLDGVAHMKKLTRIPSTFNPKRWRWAVNIDVSAFMADPHNHQIPEKPDTSLDWADPFIGDKVYRGFDFTGWMSKNADLLRADPVLTAYQAVELPVSGLGDVPIPPCLENHIRHENPAHHVRVALAQHLYENLRMFAPVEALTTAQKDKIEDQIVTFMSQLGWRDYSEYQTRKHVKSLLKTSRSPSCAWFKTRNMCSGPCWRYDYTIPMGDN